MAHTLTFSGVSVSVNGQRVSSPYTLSNGDTIIITTDDYIYVNDSSAISSSKTLNIENSDIVITTEGLRTNSYNVTINYTESTPRKSVDLSTLSGWAGLSSGAHSIQLKAKAAGYRDSELSQAVSVTKEAEGYKVTILFGGENPKTCFYSLDNGANWINDYAQGGKLSWC